MLTKREVRQTYSVSSAGFITSAGPFYLEPAYVPMFWRMKEEGKLFRERMCPGGFSWAMFSVTGAMRTEYPELATVNFVGVRRDRGEAIVSWILSANIPT